MIEIRQNRRGFYRGDFIDDSGIECSIQESNFEGLLWLGCKKQRMHITRSMARDLIPLLQNFESTGDLALAPTSVGAA